MRAAEVLSGDRRDREAERDHRQEAACTMRRPIPKPACAAAPNGR